MTHRCYGSADLLLKLEKKNVDGEGDHAEWENPRSTETDTSYSDRDDVEKNKEKGKEESVLSKTRFAVIIIIFVSFL